MLNRINDKTAGRVLALLMAVMIGVTFMPVLDHGVKAAADKKGAPKIEKNLKKIGSKVSSYKKKIGAKFGPGTSESGLFSVSAPNSNGIVTITGNIPEQYRGVIYSFDSIYVGDDKSQGYYAQGFGDETVNISTSIDMKNYSVGYHTIYVYFDTAQGKLWDRMEFVKSNICVRPVNAIKNYDVYSKRFTYSNYNYYSHDTSCNSYLALRVKGKKKYGKWKTKKNTTQIKDYNVKGIKPGKKFQTRLFYTKKVNYKGVDYTFKSKYSKIRTMKAGQKKLKVKSVTVKAYKIKRHTNRQYYRYWTSYYTYRYAYFDTHYYTYKLKVTVKLKKKPGAKGICLNSYWLKGNKKVYKKKIGQTFASYKKPTKQKFRVLLFSYQSKKYGGYSNYKKYKKRIRR